MKRRVRLPNGIENWSARYLRDAGNDIECLADGGMSNTRVSAGKSRICLRTAIERMLDLR